MKRLLWLSCLLMAPLMSLAQASPCGPPTPGQPHVCLSWVASVPAPSTGYNVYRATTSGKENYGVPLNTAVIPVGQNYFYDTTIVVGTTYYYTTCAVGTGGVLSVPTPEVSAQIPVPPNAPTGEAASID